MQRAGICIYYRRFALLGICSACYSKKDLMEMFSQYDRDNNGLISLTEASQFLSRDPFNFSQQKVSTGQ